MSKQNSVNIFTNLIWRFLEKCGAQAVTFIVSIILARLLEPEVYGTVALVMVLISIMQVFVDSGLGTALVQKKDSDSIDFSTVFYFNVIMCLLIYALIYITAPYISLFYKNPCGRFGGQRLANCGVDNSAYVLRNNFIKNLLGITAIHRIGGG